MLAPEALAIVREALAIVRQEWLIPSIAASIARKLLSFVFTAWTRRAFNLDPDLESDSD